MSSDAERRPASSRGEGIEQAAGSGLSFGEADSRVRAIVNTVIDGIITINSDGVIETFNPAAERIFGYAPSEVIGRNISMLMPSPDREQHDRYLAQYLETGTARIIGVPREVEGLRKDGSQFPMNLAISETPVGGRLLFTGIIRDVSRRRRTEEALLEAQKYESLGVLAGGIAHDFNNLLATILGNAELAMASLPAESVGRSVIEDIKLATHRAAELANQLLIYAGQGHAVADELDLSKLVEEMAPLLHASTAAGVELRFAPPAGAPVIKADATQVRQALLNLVINASDAIGGGAGSVVVSTGSMTADAAYLRSCHAGPDTKPGLFAYIEVSDTGQGMTDETLSKIFDPFFSTKFTGRGLGLAVVLGMARTHHGAIAVQSLPGAGSTFRLLLPATPTAG